LYHRANTAHFFDEQLADNSTFSDHPDIVPSRVLCSPPVLRMRAQTSCRQNSLARALASAYAAEKWSGDYAKCLPSRFPSMATRRNPFSDLVQR
jgi:hypothetical protein